MRQTGRGKRKTGRKKYTYEKPHTAAEYRRRRRQQQVRIQRMLLLLGIVLVVIFIFVLGGKLLRWIRGKHLAAADVPAAITKVVENPPDYDVQLLTINDYSRPGLAIDQVNGIVVHYTANPGTTAQQNRDYFEGLKDSHETHASSHFVIGLDGELIQCIPCKEISYASNDRNNDTISIECCIPDDTGRFNDATYQTLVHLVAWLCGRYDLNMDDVIRHYDVTGKNCPKYYVEHEDAWKQFKVDVADYIEKNGVAPENLKNDKE